LKFSRHIRYSTTFCPKQREEIDNDDENEQAIKYTVREEGGV